MELVSVCRSRFRATPFLAWIEAGKRAAGRFVIPIDHIEIDKSRLTLAGGKSQFLARVIDGSLQVRKRSSRNFCVEVLPLSGQRALLQAAVVIF